GAGKTTLFRMMLGLEGADEGEIHRSRGVRLGYLAQEVETLRGEQVLGFVMDGFEHLHRLGKELERLQEEMERATEREGEDWQALVGRYGAAQHEYEMKGGYRLESRARSILTGLGFSEEEIQGSLQDLSGGWQMRVALARLLLARPDYLLLDEPTNHLDLDSIRWLEEFLREYEGTFVLISHDRYLLNRMVKKIAELESGSLTLYSGNYDQYRVQKEERRRLQEAALCNQERRIEQVERFIERFRAKNTKATLVQSRIKMLEKMPRVTVERGAPRRLRIQLPQPPRSGLHVAQLSGVHKSYGKKVVYSGLDFQVLRGDRIALVGPNGAGKSTLLKILAGVLPYERGERTLGSHVSFFFYAQHQLDALHSEHTVLEELSEAAPLEMQPRLRAILGAFLFSGEEVEKKVSVLSGGEKSRLALARMLLKPANFLLLDEPTNHLDLDAREVLEEALEEWEGTMVFISHDRYFINRIANQVVEVKGGRLRQFLGDYDDYLRKSAELQGRGAEGGSAEEEPLPGIQRRAFPANRDTGTVRRRSKEEKRRAAEERQYRSRLL
ncbi:MAG: ABC-F family ATP-binding cassette domain-containing protein, partial [candidate division NC10 bacterium]|nr:ABC-F family ATP-binding cassette domain-containing protein [candidate division NC10 bacterium]